MPQASMSKVGLVGPFLCKDRLLHSLQTWEIMQLTNLRETLAKADVIMGTPASPVSLSEIEALQTEIGFALSFLGRFEVAKEGLIDSFMGLKPVMTTGKLAETIDSGDSKAIVAECKRLEKRQGEIQNERSRYAAELSLLQCWTALGVSPLALGSLSSVAGLLGTVNENDFDLFQQRLQADSAGLAYVERLGVSKRLACVAVVHFGKEPLPVLKESIFSQVSLPCPEDAPASSVARLQSCLARLDAEEQQIVAAAKALLESKVQLQATFDHYGHIIQREQAKTLAADTESTFVVEGWVETKRAEELKSKLADSFPEVLCLDSEASPQDIPPVRLQNRALVKPFEVVTNVYGNPLHSEVDPTPLLAPFFAVFFALSLADAGYGLILVAFSLWMIRKYKPDAAGRKFFHLFITVGILTVMVGFTMNGFFGNLITLLGIEGLIAFRNSLVLVDPMTSPMTIMILSLALGVVHISLGIAVKGYMAIKNGDVLGALLDQGTWLFLIFSLVAYALSMTVPAFAAFASITSYASLAGAIGIVLTQGRTSSSIFGKLGLGLYSLYGGVGYFSDVLSYTRILALGLSSAVIAVVINTIAVMTIDVPVFGWLFATVIFIGGHIFNVLLSTLGCFIHSARLQFVEFFTKFFEGGGKPFAPLRRISKFIAIR